MWWCLVGLALAGEWQDLAEISGLPETKVEEMVKQATFQPTVIERLSKPWEAKPWKDYFPIFLTDERLQKGLAFWKENEALLTAASQKTGVAPEMIVAILGIETKYGERMGDDLVLDALFTIATGSKSRGAFFRKELGHYLHLVEAGHMDLKTTKGSYAGAMGMGQFIPSSYRTYAVDGDGDGKKDLFGNKADAIHSIANYFAKHGWKGERVPMLVVQDPSPALDALVVKGLELNTTWAALAAKGVKVADPPPGETKCRLAAFEVEGGKEYRVLLHDFYVVTRYNHSDLYARVGVELAAQLKAGHAGTNQP